MSVTTTADEKLAEARQAVRAATKALSSILVDECWGANEFAPEFTEQMEKAFELLRRAKVYLD